MQSDDERFAASVKRLREEKGWSQGELAKRMNRAGFDGFHQTTISRIEKGDRPVRIGEARALARALGTLVGIMIAPTEEWKILDNFAKEVQELKVADSGVGRAVVDYMHQRVMVEKAWRELDELDEPEWLEEGLRELLDRHRSTAEYLLSRSYGDSIDDALDPDGVSRAEADLAEE